MVSESFDTKIIILRAVDFEF